MSSSILDQHTAACPTCRLRLEREARLETMRHEAARPLVVTGASVSYTSMSSPLGTVWLAARDSTLLGVSFAVDEMSFCHQIERDGYGTPEFAPEALRAASNQLAEFFAGRRKEFDLPIDLGRTTPFQRVVLDAVKSIPYGQVCSYGELARAIGTPNAARAVGTAVATNPISLVIPCHRVVRGDGTPGEYALRTLGSCGSSYKQMLLAIEESSSRRLAG